MEQNILHWIIQPIIAIILSAIWNRLRTANKEYDMLQKRVEMVIEAERACLLADVDRIHKGAVKQGHISNSTSRIVWECYNNYKNLGGDGYADSLMEDIKSLPVTLGK